MTYKIEEGDLLAHLKGDSNPDIERAVQESSELQAELDALQQIDEGLRRTFNDVYIFNEQDVVDVVTGQATANQRLIVDARRRRDPELDAEMKAMETIYVQPQKKSRWHLPQFLAQPIAAAMGVRSSSLIEGYEQSYHVVELQAQVTVRIVPPMGEIWALEGYVTQNNQPVEWAEIDLATDDLADSTAELVDTIQSDDQGFFALPNLEEGTYHLRVQLEDGSVLIRDLVLFDGEDED